MSDATTLLQDRGKNYGNYLTNATISQNLKDVMHEASNWNRLSADKKESLEMIALKIARLLNGNPDHLDHWRDIIGYATLIATTLKD